MILDAGLLVAFDRGERGARSFLAASVRADVVDAHLVVLAVRTGHSIITSDVGDFIALAGQLGTAAPKIHRW